MSELTYRKLAKAVADVAQASALNADRIQANAAWISEEAHDTTRTADQIAARRVDNATVAETHQLSKIMQGLSDAAIAYAAAADNTSKAATAAHAANKDSHDGINEAAAHSTVGRDIYDVDRDWLAQD
jgi:hypothetical protein